MSCSCPFVKQNNVQTLSKKPILMSREAGDRTDEITDLEKGIRIQREREKFGQLILRRIVATRFQILRPKSTKFDFGCGSAPDLAVGAYSAPLDP